MPAVRVEGVVKRFGATAALDGAGLEVPGGMVFGLLGPNGAGKTTLISIVCGIVNASQGTVSVDGHDIVKDYRHTRQVHPEVVSETQNALQSLNGGNWEQRI